MAFKLRCLNCEKPFNEDSKGNVILFKSVNHGVTCLNPDIFCSKKCMDDLRSKKDIYWLKLNTPLFSNIC